MTQITPFSIQGLQAEATNLSFDIFIPDSSLPAIHFRYLSANGQTLLSNNFQLTQEEFDAWDETMESLEIIVLNRLGLTKLATTLN